ncbi:MAG: hypothetical protein R3264_03025, partial [Anaerolineae bacterium]|nr:hypothetical protein [Anaerolineae bacterium]
NLEPHHYHQPGRLRQFQHLTLDTTHVGTRRTDLFEFYRQIKARVAHVHLSNYNGQEHQLVHNGELPLAALLEQLRHDHFEGCISLELGPYSLQADDEQALRQNLRDCLVFCQQALSVG